MKTVLLFIFLARTLFAINFDFSAPPAKEEVFEPSVLGDEVKAQTKSSDRKAPQIKIEDSQKDERELKTFDDMQEEQEQSKTIYVSHQRDIYEHIDYPKIALMVPKKVIKKYANSIADSLLSYLIYKQGSFDIELFDCQDENPQHIVNTLNKIRQKGFSLVIAPMTQRGARWIAKYEKSLIVYIPTVNKKEVPLESDNLYFGGIDYEEQIDRLLTFAGDKIAIFNDASPLAKKIASFVKDAAFGDIAYEQMIRSAKVNLAPYIKKNHRLDGTSIFLNMPIVKTSLLASQLSVYHVPYKNLLLTQIAYSPLIFSLTQYQDRQKMYIANSIGKSRFRLKDINLILGTNIDYAWVNYSTMLGMDYFLTHFIYHTPKTFQEEMLNNQVAYKIQILQPTQSSFKYVSLKK